MINKETFVKYLQNYEENLKFLESISTTFSEKFMDKLYEFSGISYDIFLESFFTERGISVINSYVYEKRKEVCTVMPRTLFEKEKLMWHEVCTIEDLYDFLIKFKEDYFLD